MIDKDKGGWAFMQNAGHLGFSIPFVVGSLRIARLHTAENNFRLTSRPFTPVSTVGVGVKLSGRESC